MCLKMSAMKTNKMHPSRINCVQSVKKIIRVAALYCELQINTWVHFNFYQKVDSVLLSEVIGAIFGGSDLFLHFAASMSGLLRELLYDFVFSAASVSVWGNTDRCCIHIDLLAVYGLHCAAPSISLTTFRSSALCSHFHPPAHPEQLKKRQIAWQNNQ